MRWLSYPVALTGLRGAACVVVGGGRVAERKVAGLLPCGARVRVISPVVSAQLEAWREEGRLEHLPRVYRNGDLQGALLAVAATDDARVNRRVADEAERSGTLVNVADDASLSTFHTPATVRQGDLTLTVSTNGSSPALSVQIARELERLYGPVYAELLRGLRALREGEARDVAPEARRALWRALVSDDVLGALRRGDRVAVRRHLESLSTDLEKEPRRAPPSR